MLKAKVLLVGACVAAFSLTGMAVPAFASDCSLGGGDTDLSGVCQIVAKHVCQGRPCLD
jgi:hypothetical protein